MSDMEWLETSPVIAAVKDEDGVRRCLKTECSVVFVLFGTILNISEIVERIREGGKKTIVHVDLIQGLGAKEIAVDYIREHTMASGIISTKPQLVKHAVEVGLLGILRTFIIDSMALANMRKQLDTCRPDAIEIMPGVIPKILKKTRTYTNIPIIAGGLLWDKKDVMEAIGAGADAVSTTKEELWYI